MIKTVKDSSGQIVKKPYSSYMPDRECLTGYINGGDKQWLLAKKTGEGIYDVSCFYRNGASVIGPFTRKAKSALEAMAAEGTSRTKGEDAELLLNAPPGWMNEMI